MTIGKKRNEQLFHDWIEDMLNDLNLHSYSYEVADLKLQHWKMLWKIFDEYIEGGFSSSEQQVAYDEGCALGKSVVLEAYGKDLEEFEIEMEVMRLVDKDDS